MVQLPENCPICGSKLVWKGVDLVCINKDCDNIKEQDLKMWTDILAPIDGLAWLTKKKYFDTLGIKSIEQLNKYIAEQFDCDVEKGVYNSITDKKIQNMINLVTYFEGPMEVALQALNIERLGVESSKKIANDKDAYNTIMMIRTAALDEMLYNKKYDIGIDFNFDDIERVVGQATTKALIENQDRLKRLSYIKILPFVEKEVSKLIGTFCVTGKLEKMKRDDLVKLAEEKGWKSLSGVTKECNYLVTNDTTSGSSKNKKAQQLGTKIITENEFYNLLGV